MTLRKQRWKRSFRTPEKIDRAEKDQELQLDELRAGVILE
jgi:hypothetical protein